MIIQPLGHCRRAAGKDQTHHYDKIIVMQNTKSTQPSTKTKTTRANAADQSKNKKENKGYIIKSQPVNHSSGESIHPGRRTRRTKHTTLFSLQKEHRARKAEEREQHTQMTHLRGYPEVVLPMKCKVP